MLTSAYTSPEWGVLEPHLVAQEKILWTGQPDPNQHLTAFDWYLIPFSVFWLGFAIFWEAGVIVSDAGPLFVLWGIPFVLAGLYFVFGRFVYRSYRRRRTVYAVTDRRVLSLHRGRSGDSVSAAFIDAVPAVNQKLRRDGSGTVIFGNPPPWFEGGADSGMDFLRGRAGAGPVAFFDVPDARAVVELVQSLRSETKRR